MAEYRLHYKKGIVGYAKTHAEYILRENNYKYKEDLIYKESGNINAVIGKTEENPALIFWEFADKNERINSVVYREIELNIPNNLKKSESIELIKNFVKKELNNSPYTFAIHETYNENGEKNIHCHLMFSERDIDGINRTPDIFFKRANSKNPDLGGAKKNRIWQKKEKLLSLRKSWEVETNLILKKYKYKERVDCRSLANRRKEFLEKGEFAKAEALNRKAINISGKTLIKLKKIGYENLSKEEKKSIDEYNKNKEIKNQKERELAILEGRIIPTKKEAITRLSELKKLETIGDDRKFILDEIELKKKTVNILSKGVFLRKIKEVEKLEKKQIAYPNNDIISEKIKSLKEEVLTLADLHVKSDKYNYILEKIKNDYNNQKNLFTKILKDEYNLNPDYEVAKINNQVQEKKEDQEKIKFIKRLKNNDIQELNLRLKELEKQDDNHVAMQLLSNYRIEGLGLMILEATEERESNYSKRISAVIYNQKEEVKILDEKEKILKNKIEKCDNEYLNILNKIHQNPSLFNETLEYVKKSRNQEEKILKNLIREKNINNITPNSYKKVEEYFNLLSKMEKLKDTYNYFLKNNDDEKHNKSLYKLHSKINVMEDILLNDSKEIFNLSNNTMQVAVKLIKDNYKEKINFNQQKITVLDTGIKKLETFLSEKKFSNGYTAAEIIAVNKITKGIYSLNFKEKEKIKKDILSLKKEQSTASFFKKNSLNKNIGLLEKTLDSLVQKENNILKKYKDTDILKVKTKEIKNNLENSLINLKTTHKLDKSNLNIYFNVLKKVSNLEEKIQIPKDKKIQQANKIKNIKTPNIGKELSKLLREGKGTNSTYSNMEIKLEKEKESWEI